MISRVIILKQIFVLIGLLSFGGCLASVNPLDGSSNEVVAKDLLGGWELLDGDYANDVGPNHRHLNVFVVLNSTDVMIVGDKERVVEPSDAFNQCSQSRAVCFDTVFANSTILQGLHLISLKDHFSTDPDNAYMIMAWAIEDGKLVVYDIKDKSVEAAITKSILKKQKESGNIASDSKEIEAWLSTLSMNDLRVYAKYSKAQQIKDWNDLPANGL